MWCLKPERTPERPSAHRLGQWAESPSGPRASRSSKYAGNPVREIPGCAHGERENSDFP